MAEKQIRLPKWNGEEYYPATTTEAVADRDRQKGLNEVLNDIEYTIDSNHRTNQNMLNQKQDKLNRLTESQDQTVVESAVTEQGLKSSLYLQPEQAALVHYNNPENTHEGTGVFANDNGIYLFTDVNLGKTPFYIKKSGSDSGVVCLRDKKGATVSEDMAGYLQNITNAVNTLNGTGEGSVSKTVTDKIAEVVANAPSDFDTLKEIADYIESDKTNAAEINNTLTAIKTRVYDLGDFSSSGAAEAKAAEEAISRNPSISIIHYSVNHTTSHIILQDVNNNMTQQVLYYGGHTYIRHIGANLNASWKKTNATNIKYNPDSHRIALMHMVNQYGEDGNNIDWVELPTATATKDGLMTKEQVASLEGKQDQLRTYHETDGYKHVSVGVENVFHAETSCGDKDTRSVLLLIDKDETDIAEARTATLYTENTSKDNYGGNYIQADKDAVLLRSTHLGTASEVQVSHDKIKMASGGNVIGDVVKEIIEKAPKVGYAPDLKVNFAKELVGRGDATPEVIGGIRPTGVRSIGDGNATIERIKGDSVVWNQCMNIINVVPQYDSSLYTITKSDNTCYISKKEGGTTSSDNIFIYFKHDFIAAHKYLIIYNLRRNDGENPSGKIGGGGIYDGASYHQIPYGPKCSFFSPTSSFKSVLQQIGQEVTTGVAISYTIAPVIHDLTLMFGAGNEPTTIEEFEARKPLGVSNEYNEGTIVSYDGEAIKSVGFNAWDEEWENGKINQLNGANEENTTFKRSVNYTELIKNTEYRCTYTNGTSDSVWMMFFDLNGNPIEHKVGYVQVDNLSNVKNASFVTPNQDCKVRFYVKNEPDSQICIHLAHTYTPERYPNGYAPYTSTTIPLPNVSLIKDADGNQLFPYGLLSAGSVHDEITATKAIKRVGHKILNGTEPWYTTSYGMNTFVVNKFLKDNAKSKEQKVNWLSNRYENKHWGYSLSTVTDKMLYVYNADINIIGVVDTAHTTSAEFKNSLAANPIMLYYELAEPIEVDLPEPLNMTYEAWDFGTEELVADSTTTPLNADIVYQFNAVDRIRENSTNILNKQDTLVSGTNIKTINGQTILGSGDITIQGGGGDLTEVNQRLDNLESQALVTEDSLSPEVVTDYSLMSGDIVQTSGISENKIMSQKAVTDALNNIRQMIVTTLNTPI